MTNERTTIWTLGELYDYVCEKNDNVSVEQWMEILECPCDSAGNPQIDWGTQYEVTRPEHCLESSHPASDWFFRRA